jgi:hypothetical protein
VANTNQIQNFLFGLTGFGTLLDAPFTIGTGIDNWQIGSQNTQFPGDTSPQLQLTTGTGNGQGNQWACQQRVLAATTFDLLNLQDAALGLKNDMGQPIQLVKVKFFALAILSHDGTKKLQIGPQGQSNAWPGWWQAVTANFYDVEYWFIGKGNDSGNGLGPAITPTTNILPVFNPTGSPITYAVLVGGNE